MTELVSAMVVCKLAGVPDLPPFETEGGVGLYVRDDKSEIIDGCGFTAVGHVGDKGIAIYRVTSSQATIDAIKANPLRWAVMSDVPKTVADVTARKALLATDPKLATTLSKEAWTTETVHARTLAALGVTETEYAQAKMVTTVDAKPMGEVIK